MSLAASASRSAVEPASQKATSSDIEGYSQMHHTQKYREQKI